MNIKFMDYKNLVEGYVWKAAARTGTLDDLDEWKSHGYLVFCKAVKRYNKSSGYKFSTYLTHCLRDVYNYIQREKKRKIPVDMRDIEMLTQLSFDEDTNQFKWVSAEKVVDEALLHYDTFVETLERVESLVELSDDAQAVLTYVLDWGWYIPGVRYRPFLASTANWFKRYYDWGYTRVKRAWEEISEWWINEPFAEPATA